VLHYFASSFDRVFSTAVLKRGGRTQAEAILGAEARVVALSRILERYGDPSFVEQPENFFVEPPTADPELRSVREHVFDVCYPSDYRAFNPDIEAEYLAHERNAICPARLFLTKGDSRGTVILLHGYLGGMFVIEERIWPIQWLLEQRFNAALFTLPFHGLRGRTLTQPVFPGSDPRVTIEGFRQAIHDLRRFVGWLIQRKLGPVGAMGMSLGGYTAALLATVERRLSFVVPYIPLASIARFALDRGRFVGSEAQKQKQHDLVDRIYRVVSPLARPAQVPKPGRLVVAGRADQITPLLHAQLIATHFEAPLETFEGGHLMQLGRGRAFRRIGLLLDAVK
jgi:pimeloyl-ACP methyl ester carboxylesterase